MTKNRNFYLDLFKIVLCYLVIIIHCGHSYIPLAITRIAVPIFFIIAGYFSFYDSDNNLLKCKNKIKRLFKIIFFSFFIYFLYDVCTIIISKGDLGTYLTRLLYDNPIVELLFYNKPKTSGFHLWFLLALLIVYLLNFLCQKYKLVKLYRYIPFLLIVTIFVNIYMPKLGLGSVDLCFTRNAIFMGFPFFVIGYLLKECGIRLNKINKFYYLFFGILFLCLSVFESQLGKGEFYFSTILSSLCLVEFFVLLPCVSKNFWFYKYIGSNANLYIYIFHILVQRILGHFMVTSALIVFVITTLFVVGFLFFYNLFKQHISKKNQNNT